MLPGCITWGKMRNEAVEMAEDAIEAWVLTALRFGDEIPEVDGCVLQYAVDEPVRATPPRWPNFVPRSQWRSSESCAGLGLRALLAVGHIR
jgi:predicted RNase H-like HicB family nuclease